MNATQDLDRVRQAFDAEWSRIYREQMDTLVAGNKSGSYRHYGAIVEQLSSSFGRPIVALDLGCGTGRHINLLKNVERLVAIDLSEHMIEQARNPIFAEKITVGTIEYLVGDVYSTELRESTFDLIYCIGVVGELRSGGRGVFASLACAVAPRRNGVLHGHGFPIAHQRARERTPFLRTTGVA